MPNLSKRIVVPLALVATSFALAGVWGYAQSVTAAPSQHLPYQGYIEKDGAPLDGSIDMVFRIWNHPTSTTAASRLWTESRTAVAVVGGRFSILLGEVTALPASVFAQQQLFLEVGVNDGSQIDLLGRQQLGAVPFARGADPGGAFVGQDGFSVTTVTSGVADAAPVVGSYSRVNADSFHSNGLGSGQIFIEGSYIDANSTIYIGTGVAGGQSAVNVTIGGSLAVASTITSTGKLVCLEDGTNCRRGGALYTRWGRTTCPTGATKVYDGYLAGNHQTHGGASSALCMTKSPTWSAYSDANQDGALLYGAEYQMSGTGLAGTLANLHDDDVPCAVCVAPAASLALMHPGSKVCPGGWTQQYNGYLMGKHYQQSTGETLCVDIAPQAIGSVTNSDGYLLYPMEAQCGSLPCGAGGYVQDRELTCSICTQ